MNSSSLARLALFAIVLTGCGGAEESLPRVTRAPASPAVTPPPPRGLPPGVAAPPGISPFLVPAAPADWKTHEFRGELLDFSIELPGSPMRDDRFEELHRVSVALDRGDYSITVIKIPPLQAHAVEFASDAERDKFVSLSAEATFATAMSLGTERFGNLPYETERSFHYGMRMISRTFSEFEQTKFTVCRFLYDPEKGRLYLFLGYARRPGNQDAMGRIFRSFRPNDSHRPQHKVDATKYAGEFAADAGAARRRYADSIVELTGRVDDLRVRKGAFDVLHRYVVLSPEANGSAEAPPEVLCSMNDTPWEKVSTGSAVTIRGHNIGLAGGTLVSCDIVTSEGSPCPTVDSQDLAKEFATDPEAAERKYAGSVFVVTGRVIANPDSELPDRHAGLFLAGQPDRPVFCVLSKETDIEVSEFNVDDEPRFLVHLSEGAKERQPVILSDCHLLTPLEP